MMDVCAACSCMREADRAGRVVRWKNRKYIYRYACMHACMVVWEMSGCMCGMCGRAAPTYMVLAFKGMRDLYSPIHIQIASPNLTAISLITISPASSYLAHPIPTNTTPSHAHNQRLKPWSHELLRSNHGHMSFCAFGWDATLYRQSSDAVLEFHDPSDYARSVCARGRRATIGF